MQTRNSCFWSWNCNDFITTFKRYSIISNGGYEITPTLLKREKYKKE